MKIFFHILTNDFDLAVLSEIVNDQVLIDATKVVTDQRDLDADWSLRFALAVSNAYKLASDVVLVTDFEALCFAFYKLVTTDITLRCIIILFFLASTKAVYRSIS